MQWLWKARDNGAKLIVLDPRETATARTSDLWLPVRPGTDIVVLNAMLRQIIHDGLVDEDVPSGADLRLGRGPSHRRELHAGAGRAHRRRARRANRRRGAPLRPGRRSLIMHARGVEHSTHGVNNCLACINLALARGQVGKPGSGTMMITGQGNGQGGREVGQKANQLPGYRHIDVAEDREYVAKVWGIPVEEMPDEGAAATEMVHLMAEGEIKSCMVICSNLMVSLPDNAVVQRAIERLDPLVVVDFFLSETAELADVVLPGSVWCEEEGTTTNLEGRVVKINRAVEPARRGSPRLADRLRACPPAGSRAVLPVPELARDLGGAPPGDEGRRVRLLRHHLGEDRGRGRRLLAVPVGEPSGNAPALHRALRPSRRSGQALLGRVHPTGRGADRAVPVPADHRAGRLPLPERQPDAPARLPEQPGAGAVGRDPSPGGCEAWASRTRNGSAFARRGERWS